MICQVDLSVLMRFLPGQDTTCCGTGTRASAGCAETPSLTRPPGYTRPGASSATRSSPPPTRPETSLMWRSSSTPTTWDSSRSSSVLSTMTPRRPTSVLINTPWQCWRALDQAQVRGGAGLVAAGCWWCPTSPAEPRGSGRT